MRVTGLRRPDRLELGVGGVRAAQPRRDAALAAWETIPFHLIWFTLTLLYGFRVWALKPTFLVLTAQGIVTGFLIAWDASNGTHEWGELFEVPLMSAMFLAMVWHARRHRAAAVALERAPRERADDRGQAGALPPRRVARAAHADHDRPRAPRDPAPQRRRAARRRSRWRSTSSRAWSASSSGCCCSSARASRLRHDRGGGAARDADRGRRDALGRGGSAGVARRRGSAAGSHRPGRAADRARRAGGERRRAHRRRTRSRYAPGA